MITLAAKFLMNVNRISLFTLVLLSIFLLGCSEDTKEIDNIKLARFYMAQDKDALALNFLGTELKAGKNLREAHRLMGTLFNNAEFFGDAVSHFQSAIELGCTQACDEGLIDAYLGLGEYALAEQEFSANISDKNSKSSQYRLILFEFFKNKNFQQTITQLEKIDIQGAKYWILRLMYEQGRYEEIIASFNKAADYSADQLLLFAKAYYALKQYEKSNDILSLFGSNKTGQLLTKRKIQSIELLVKVNTALGRKDQAKLIYQEFLESNEDAGYVRFKNALTHLSNSEFDGAIDEIGELSEAYPDNSPIALALAMAQFGKKNYQEVIASLGNVKGGINEHSMVLLASAYNKIGRPQETIDLLQGVERNNMLTVLLARAYFLKKDYKKSREMLEDILIDPDLDPVNRKLARLWFDLSQFNNIISSFSSNVGHSPAIKYLVIASYLKLQKISLARQYISNESNPVLSREMLAFLEGRTGNLDKSIQIYSELAQQNPTRKNYFLLSLSYIKNNDYPGALKTIQAGTSLEGENQLLLKLANRIMLEKNGFETRQWLDSFKADHRDYKKIQKMLANYQIRQSQNEEAIRRLAPFIDDEDKEIYYLMALAKKDSDPQDSVRLMEKSLSTEFSMLAASRLHTHYQGNNDAKNLERINSQIEQFGGINSRTTKLLARGYLFLNAYGKAIALADLLIKQGQADAGNELLGDILAHQGKYDEAIAIYKKVMGNNVSEQLMLKHYTAKIKSNPENVLVVLSEADGQLMKTPEMYGLRKLIGIHYIDKDNKAAVQHLTVLLDKFPNDIVLLNNLAWASLELDPAAALRYSTEAYRIDSDNFNIIDTHVRALKQNDQVDSARNLLENKISDNPNNPQLKSLLNFLN